MELPTIDLDLFLFQSLETPAVQHECKKVRSILQRVLAILMICKVADALITFGALILHDSRVTESKNSAFLDLLEDYFAQSTSDIQKDERPELSYQVGVTLENTEKPKCAVDESCLGIIQRLEPSERPLDISAHSPDPKCRFFWKMSEVPPYETQFPGLNAPNVVPQAEEINARWTQIMEDWGESMKQACALLSMSYAYTLNCILEWKTLPIWRA